LLEGEARASREELEGLSIAALRKLCKERGIKGLSHGPRPERMDALLSHPAGPPLRSELPAMAARGGKAGGALAASARISGAQLQRLEQRLDRLERLVMLVALQGACHSRRSISCFLPLRRHCMAR
jgi:hypothetical protein